MPTAFQLGLSAWMPLPYMWERGQENTLEVFVEKDGAPAVITDGSVEIYDADGRLSTSGDVMDLQEEEPGRARFTSTPSASLPLGEGWRVVWTLTIGGENHTFENSGMCVRSRLVNPITMRHVWSECPQLNPAHDGPITTMTAADQSRLLQAAWIRVQTRLLEMGRRPYLVIGGYSLATVTLHTTLQLAFAALAHAGNEAYLAESERHRELAEEAWKRVRVDYDENQDGRPEARVPARPSGWWIGRGAR